MTTYLYPPLDSAPADVYQEFVTAMQGLIPDWQPASGNLDDWIGQAMAGIIAQLTEITSDVATSIFRYFGAFIANLPPVAASTATGVTNWTAVDTVGYTIPAGTSLVFTDANGNTQGFSTIQTATISPGASAVNSVSVVADNPGAASNNLTGSAQSANTTLAWVQSVTLAQATTGGADAESDDVYLNRLASLYTILSPKPVTAADFSVLALQQAGVGRAVTLDGFDPGVWTITGNVTNSSVTATNVASPSVSAIPLGATVTGANIPANTFVTATNPASGIFVMSAAATGSATGENIAVVGSLRNGGEVSVFVTDPTGVALSSPAMSVIQAALAARRLANFTINVLAPTYTPINVSVNLFAWPGANTAQVQAGVLAAIQNFLSPANFGMPPTGQPTPGLQAWQNDNVVRYQWLYAAILQVPGVHYCLPPTVNGGTVDIPLPGVVPLPQDGTITVNAQTG